MTSPTKIELHLIGQAHRIVDLDAIAGHHSDLYRIKSIKHVEYMPPMEGHDWRHSMEQYSEKVIKSPDCDIAIAITAEMLEDNFYIKRIDNNRCVISCHELTEVILTSGNTIEQFYLRNILEMVVLFIENNKSLKYGDRSFIHDDTRGCLFDMNGYKPNIVYSLHRPELCDECSARLKKNSIDISTINLIKAAAHSIRKPTYNIISEWVKRHPYWSFTITSLWALIINIAATAAWECLTKEPLSK